MKAKWSIGETKVCGINTFIPGNFVAVHICDIEELLGYHIPDYDIINEQKFLDTIYKLNIEGNTRFYVKRVARTKFKIDLSRIARLETVIKEEKYE
jgi:hypothetical protein